MATGRMDADSLFLSRAPVLLDKRKQKYRASTVNRWMIDAVLGSLGKSAPVDIGHVLTSNQDDKWYWGHGGADFYRQLKNRAAIFRNAFIPPFSYEVFDKGILITDTIVWPGAG